MNAIRRHPLEEVTPNNFETVMTSVAVLATIITAVIFFLAGCGAGGSGSSGVNPPVIVPNVVVNPSAVTLGTGESYTFNASGGKTTVTWSLSDTTMGTIVATARSCVYTAPVSKIGTVMLTCTPAETNGAAGFAVITVTGVYILEGATFSMSSGTTHTFSARGGKGPYVWSSSDGTVGQFVDPRSGTFQAFKPGTCTVQVKDLYTGSLSALCTVTVTSGMVVSPSSLTVTKGSVYNNFYVSGGTPPYTWESADTSVATITPFPNDTTHATLQASAAITASTTVTTTITVRDVYTASATSAITVKDAVLQVYPKDPSIAYGSAAVTFQVSGGTAPYTWVLSVNTLGTLSAVGSDTSMIKYTPPAQHQSTSATDSVTLTVVDVNNNQTTSKITLTQPFIQIYPTSISLTQNAAPYTFYAYGGVKPYTWTIDNLSVGSIEADPNDSSLGIFTPRSPGTGNITVKDANNNQSTGTVTVTLVANPLTVSPSTLTIAPTETYLFNAVGGTPPYTWTVNDTHLGSVTTGSDTSQATFNALNPGSVILTCVDKIKGSAVASITVTNPAGSVPQIYPASLVIKVGATYGLFAYGGFPPYVWSANNVTIGTVAITSATDTSRATFTAVAAGVVIIRVFDARNTAGFTCTITVIP
ncbi:MAG: hypothetical protein HQK59_13225 [Deltaproteobacteria bacterium]|nr:hypothetical protein [Deltaproteobacteria bacterium]